MAEDQINGTVLDSSTAIVAGKLFAADYDNGYFRFTGVGWSENSTALGDVRLDFIGLEREVEERDFVVQFHPQCPTKCADARIPKLLPDGRVNLFEPKETLSHQKKKTFKILSF